VLQQAGFNDVRKVLITASPTAVLLDIYPYLLLTQPNPVESPAVFTCLLGWFCILVFVKNEFENTRICSG
jgi:hypothetical protein